MTDDRQRRCDERDAGQVSRFLARMQRRATETPEERDARRLEEIRAMRDAGVANADEYREEREIRRRVVERGFR